MEELQKSMRINAPKGQKVIFKSKIDGLWGGGHANDQLEEEAVYTVEKTKVFKSHSFVELKGYLDTMIDSSVVVIMTDGIQRPANAGDALIASHRFCRVNYWHQILLGLKLSIL